MTYILNDSWLYLDGDLPAIDDNIAAWVDHKQEVGDVSEKVAPDNLGDSWMRYFDNILRLRDILIAIWGNITTHHSPNYGKYLQFVHFWIFCHKVIIIPGHSNDFGFAPRFARVG